MFRRRVVALELQLAGGDLVRTATTA